ncbi:hypothetical protein RRG08_033362 [Elysia crispata]|uniref:DUF4371 domain-containing protein n=1 Tax=Elysia crispata TaxID=231223 RepID=A0AAE1DBX4_9GAST|nr:hypothetical protein RRG08_033362 [Elysia crispata]
MPEHFLDRSSDLKVVESSVRNKFKWTWLEEKDVNNDFLSEYVRKLAQPAFASINAANADNTCAPRISPPSFKDRVSQQQAMVCSFISEHTLPFSIAPHLIKFAQALASDHKALQALSMERFCATYKLTHGVHEVTRKRIVNKLRTVPFSINLDEATSKSNKKRVLNILVCYFDSDTGESVTHLYSSVELVVVNASTVHAAVVGKLKEDGIPLQNLISSLSDSAAYMRGTHNGYEAKIKI